MEKKLNRKIVIHSAGGYDKLKLETGPDLKPGDNEVLVATQAIGVNYADCCVRWGVYESAKKYVGWPITPGFEFAGTVVETGKLATRFKKGDQVFGIVRFNAYASQIVVPESQVYLIPKNFKAEEAAAFPAVFMTAYHALFQNVRIRPGMVVLIHSAAGGVGSALIQLAKIAGLRTVGVVGSSHKIDYVKRLGVDAVIDKSKEDLWTKAKEIAPNGFDLVLDANGPETLKEGYRHLRPTGKVISYGFHTLLPKQGGRIKYLKAAWGMLKIPRFHPLSMTNENKGVVAFNVSFLFDRNDLLNEGMTDLLSWIEQGKIHPPQVTCFPLEKVAQAHQKIESGSSVGKLVLIP